MIQHDKDAVRRAEYPDRLVENYVRVAHLYNLTTEKVRQNFAIAGVPLSIDSVFKSITHSISFFCLNL